MRFVPGSEIENPSLPALPSRTAAEYLAAGKPRDKDQFVGRWHAKRLAIHFFCGDFEKLADPAGIGCAGFTFHSRALSLDSRHFNEQVVPSNALKIFA